MHHRTESQQSDKITKLFDEVNAALISKFGAELLNAQIDYDFPVFEVSKTSIHESLEFLKNDPSMAFGFLTTMCGSHFPEQGDREFMLMYQLHSLEKNTRIRIKTFMSLKDIEVPTVTDLWKGANWMERETFDFYGFKFKGHPNLKRILNMDEMNYYPLRKQYPLEDGSRDDKADKYFGR